MRNLVPEKMCFQLWEVSNRILRNHLRVHHLRVCIDCIAIDSCWHWQHPQPICEVTLSNRQWILIDGDIIIHHHNTMLNPQCHNTLLYICYRTYGTAVQFLIKIRTFPRQRFKKSSRTFHPIRRPTALLETLKCHLFAVIFQFELYRGSYQSRSRTIRTLPSYHIPVRIASCGLFFVTQLCFQIAAGLRFTFH